MAPDELERPQKLDRVGRWLADKLEVAVLLPTLVAVTGTSILVTQGNLVSSGVAVFVENPLLSWAVSGIAPGFSIGLKSMASQFETDRGKKLFGRALMAAMVISGLTWLWLLDAIWAVCKLAPPLPCCAPKLAATMRSGISMKRFALAPDRFSPMFAAGRAALSNFASSVATSRLTAFWYLPPETTFCSFQIPVFSISSCGLDKSEELLQSDVAIQGRSVSSGCLIGVSRGSAEARDGNILCLAPDPPLRSGRPFRPVP